MIRALEKAEEKLGKREIAICEEAIGPFKYAAVCCHYGSQQSHSFRFVAFNTQGDIDNFKHYISETQARLSQLNNYEDVIIVMAGRIERALLLLRNRQNAQSMEQLTTRELEITNFAKGIKGLTSNIIGWLKSLSEHNLERARNVGYFQPQDVEIGRELYKLLYMVDTTLQSLKGKLEAFFTLDHEVNQSVNHYLSSISQAA
ncbi:hypothetical protein HYW19_02975 [Candidatus Woesearchaeota archaeon]|nr:hypothetical protein [Candidatus Woesearchaeota archaeon]